MSIHLTPQAGIPTPKKSKGPGFSTLLDAAVETAKLLTEAGLDAEPTETDLDDAAKVAKAVAAAPGSVSSNMILTQRPAALLMTQKILEDFGHKVVQEAERVRHLVMNKLVIETENPDPKIRIRALELLGKMGDVSLFTEKKEVTVTHQTSGDVRDRLRARLARLIPSDNMEDAEIIETSTVIEKADVLTDDEIYELSMEPRLAAGSFFDDDDDD